MRNLYFIAALFLTACINENTLSNSFPIQLLHGNSAKVWVLTKSSDPDDKSIAAMDDFRKTFIFYSNHSFRQQELIHLGSNKGNKGSFRINENDSGELSINLFYNHNDREQFLIKGISNNTLTLLELDGNHATWELKSLKPPKL